MAFVIALLVFCATRSPGPGLDPDAMAYTGAATSLVEHHTLRVPTGEWSRADSTSALSFWPPGYSAAIAVPMLGGASATQGGRIINVVAAALTALTLILLVSGAVGFPAGIITALVVFATPAVFDVHLSVLSEPLFITCLLFTLAAMVYARDRLVLLGVVATLAVMVRYIGACAPAAVVLWTLSDGRYAMKRRMWRALAVAFLPLVAIVGWFTRTAMAPDRHGTPTLAVYGHWGDTFGQAGTTMAQWLSPQVPEGATQASVALVLGLALVFLVVATMRDTASSRFRQRPAERVSAVLKAAWLLVVMYLVALCGARLFVGGTIPFDWRILSPVIVLLEIIVVTSVAHWWRAYHRPVHVAIVVAALVWVGASAWVTASHANDAVSEGSDFAASAWRESPVLQWVRHNGAGHTLYSNWPPAVYFHAHRIARELPDSDEVREELPEFGKVLRASNGVIVGFRERSPDVVAPDSIARLLGLRPIATLPDGTIWAP